MADLSPAAQAVFWEFNRAASGKPDDWHYMPAIAAALRAAADQVVPAASHLDRAFWNPFAGQIRAELLALAAELKQADG